jgi:Ca-activated chloride channel family protein
MAGELNLTATLHRAAYQAMPTPQQAFILLEAMPTCTSQVAGTPVAAQHQAVNFCLVLDRSGSMAGEKLNQLKAAARLVVDRLGAQDYLSMVIFDERAEVILPSCPVQNAAAIHQRVNLIEERGGTHMSSGMQAGLHELQRGMAADRVSRMLLLTDGQTWEDQPACEGLADQARLAGIPIYVMGLGVGAENNWDPRFLENLAQHSGGEWVVIDTPDKVSTAFAHILSAMQDAAVTNASLTIRFVEGVEPRAIWRVVPLISRLGHSALSKFDLQLFLGDIQQQVGQSLLLDVLLPERNPGAFRLLQADISYDVPSSGQTAQRLSLDIVVPYTSDPLQAQKTHPGVMNLAERVVAHKLQTQALDEAAAGQLQKATVRLRAAATRLLDLGETELAQQSMQQAEKMEQSGMLDPAAAQQLRYATKRLTENNDPLDPTTSASGN